MGGLAPGANRKVSVSECVCVYVCVCVCVCVLRSSAKGQIFFFFLCFLRVSP